MCFWWDPTRSIGFANFQARQKNVVWCEMESRVSGQFRERLPLHFTAVADWKRADSRQNDFCATNLEARLFFLEGIARFFLSPSLFLSSFISYQVFFSLDISRTQKSEEESFVRFATCWFFSAFLSSLAFWRSLNWSWFLLLWEMVLLSKNKL